MHHKAKYRLSAKSKSVIFGSAELLIMQDFVIKLKVAKLMFIQIIGYGRIKINRGTNYYHFTILKFRYIIKILILNETRLKNKWKKEA